jgi:two-component system sensor histidine kinase BaeS
MRDSLRARLLVALLPATLAAMLAGWLAGQRIGEPVVRATLLIAMVVFLTVATAVLVARGVTRRLQPVTRAAGRLAEGRLDVRIRGSAHDELGELARAFNAMATALAEAESLRRRRTSDVAHELRSPLSNIRGYLEAAQDGVAPLTPGLLRSIHDDTMLLQALVDDLQQLSAAESGNLDLDRRPTAIDDLVLSVATAHQARAATAGIRLTADAHSDAWAIVDPRRIRQVLSNLLDNAIRHTGVNGRITVSTRRLGDAAEVMVSDTGSGIPSEHLPFIFDRFHRADRSADRGTDGSGLGLAITRGLVAAHGGDIAVSSTEGLGTAFTVRLPLASSTPEVRSGMVAAVFPEEPPALSARPTGTATRPVDFTYIDVC